MQLPERADDQPVKLRTARGGVRVHVAPERETLAEGPGGAQVTIT
jgi:hypothetical protein